MDVPRDGVVFATVTFTSYPDSASTAEVSLDRHTWFPFDVVPHPSSPGRWEGKVLLRGPEAPGTDGHLVTGRSMLWARVTDSPEVIPVSAGPVFLV